MARKKRFTVLAGPYDPSGTLGFDVEKEFESAANARNYASALSGKYANIIVVDNVTERTIFEG